MKYIIVAGGVMSGLGKGITAASLGLLLKSRGIKTTLVKCDMYLNIDAGTMNPVEHGEVFVTHDGLETDQDLGHYERFLGTNLTRANYMTNGQIYKTILDNERALKYDGKCVEPYHMIPPEIIARWKNAGTVNNVDVVIVELGGTVGEYEGLLFFEAARRIKHKNPNDLVFILVGYLPAPPSIGELKSKPLQQSVSSLNSLGISPDFIVARAEIAIDAKRKSKIALASGLSKEEIISNPDMSCVYEVPSVLKKQGFDDKVIKKLGLWDSEPDLKEWEKMLRNVSTSTKKIRIGIIGKYQRTGDYLLQDSYVCVLESIKHAGWKIKLDPEIVWIDSEALEKKNIDINIKLENLDGIIVPQGWGSRGSSGKIKAIKYARENKIPFLGLCYGMQMAAVEFARNVLNLKSSHSEEIKPNAKHKIIHTMQEQRKYLKNNEYGGTIRLGAWPCKFIGNTKLKRAYEKHSKASSLWKKPNPEQMPVKGKNIIYERHRHRFEFNNLYKKQFEKSGMIVSGTSPDGKLVEAIELKDHPFFVGTQFHPEYLSNPLAPHPLFIEFLKTCNK